ncbi:histidine kinase N-terminal domain-containing protein [Arcanobacterium hippocoleae]
MPTLKTILERSGYSQPYANEWLHQLIGDWQAVADLAFADLILLIPEKDDFVVGAHTRPATAATLLERDIIGEHASTASPDIYHGVRAAYLTGEIAQFTRDLINHKFVPVNIGGYGASEGLAAAVHGSANSLNSLNSVEQMAESGENDTENHAGDNTENSEHKRRAAYWKNTQLLNEKPIAVIHAMSAVFPDLSPTQLHQNYGEVSDTLFKMVSTGEFPMEGTPSRYRHGTPRVSDGVISMDADGEVLYASPNSVSHFRRLGIDKPLVGQVLAEIVSELITDNQVPDEQLPLVLMGRAAWVTEFDSRGVIISMRALPLKLRGEKLGAVLLSRDVSELRRQEAKLHSKDATIREINHRVKNNLQTVSALLRLQARRATNEESRQALEQAQRRVAMIAIVHEGLSQTIDEVVEFDEVFGSLLRIVRDISVTENAVEFEFTGSFGRVRAEHATALAVVVNELISNAIEHGVSAGGNVWLAAVREEEQLILTVSDNGVGIGDGGPGSGLGTQIVQTLVHAELNGTIEWKNRDGGGTQVTAKLRLQK